VRRDESAAELAVKSSLVSSGLGNMAHDRIEMNPEIMGGKPVIRGTRVPVELILRKLGAGMSAAAILADHPKLTLDDIRATQAFSPSPHSGAPG
jgi:uncharacterized protein (DUF433 family)